MTDTGKGTKMENMKHATIKEFVRQRPVRVDAEARRYRCGIYGYNGWQCTVDAHNEQEAKRLAAGDFKIPPKAIWVKKIKEKL